ncbi:NADH-ubiquinone oxidoreductase chain 5 [Capsicum annuum]|nr:NADH-ubiquinone oxidoreductase chain 5 [Capsicum annuum]KAF3677491.1 NADH-ubiquinone oxidoreductase chain 5 [Capsicum annuum]
MRLNAITFICILLFIGAVGKSAQIGSHTWSPDAMEGPTPVFALIHANTMVTTGVFMIARCFHLFEYLPMTLIVITFAGAMTSFLATTTGILQNNRKRVIAYSTCSQLGYMIFACGISNYLVSVFHLMNDAFFKELLFLSAGLVIHVMSDEQDIWKMGGLASSFPFTYAMMLMGNLSLIGFPFLIRFYCKDMILDLAYTKYTISGNFAFWLGSVSVLFTSY